MSNKSKTSNEQKPEEKTNEESASLGEEWGKELPTDNLITNEEYSYGEEWQDDGDIMNDATKEKR